jgi:hypothetical protein
VDSHKTAIPVRGMQPEPEKKVADRIIQKKKNGSLELGAGIGVEAGTPIVGGGLSFFGVVDVFISGRTRGGSTVVGGKLINE